MPSNPQSAALPAPHAQPLLVGRRQKADRKSVVAAQNRIRCQPPVLNHPKPLAIADLLEIPALAVYVNHLRHRPQTLHRGDIGLPAAVGVRVDGWHLEKARWLPGPAQVIDNQGDAIGIVVSDKSLPHIENFAIEQDRRNIFAKLLDN